MGTTSTGVSGLYRDGVAPRYSFVARPATQEALRRGFRSVNRAMVLMWRLGLGPLLNSWPPGFGRILVVEHVGRTSGTRYRTPLNYTVADEDLYCVAAFGERTDWYRNAMATPTLGLWLPSGRWTATAVDVTDQPGALDLVRGVLIDSGFAAPLFGLFPRRMSDDDLAAATTGYRLVRIDLDHRIAHEGPADLAWVWAPIAIAGGLLLRRRRRCRSMARRMTT